MKNARQWGKTLLWVHLFVCCIWLTFFRLLNGAPVDFPEWASHVIVWSVLGVQFTWGFTVGLLVGPSRKRRGLLWWSLLTVFFPLWFYGIVIFAIGMIYGPLLALIYVSFFAVVLACETFCGVLLGVKTHADDKEE